MATQVSYEGKWEHIFKFAVLKSTVHTLFVYSLSYDGIVSLEPVSGTCTIRDVAEVISGLFDNSSNFSSELSRAFGKGYFTQIHFSANGRNVRVTASNATPEQIYAAWDSQG